MNKKMLRNIIISAAVLLVIVAAILVIVFVPFGSGSTSTLDEIDYGIDMETYVNADNLHCAKINTNSKGEIENNSYGTLLSYGPADIDRIEMHSADGNYTFKLETPKNENGETEETIYTLLGFEDYDLASTNPALLASALSSIDFVKVADLKGDNADEYGFDAPRAEASVYLNDGTYAVITLGDDAPGGTYCYIKFGDNDTVYIAELSDFEPMLLKITDLFSKSINSDATSIPDDSFDKIILGGSRYSNDIVITASTDSALSCYYVMESDGNAPVSTVYGSSVTGSIKTINADEVVCVNPDENQLEEYGLKTPYATVKTTYSYTDTEYDADGNSTDTEKTLSVSLLASSEQDGSVYLMQEGGRLIYKTSASSLAWATVTEAQLRDEYVLSPVYSAVDSVVLECDGKTYTFTLSREDKTTTDEDGNETTETVTKVSHNGKNISESQFYVLFEDLTLMEVAGEDSTASGDVMLKITYNYNTSRSSDTVIIRSTGTQKALPELNGRVLGYVYKSYVTALVDNIKALSDGKQIASVR